MNYKLVIIIFLITSCTQNLTNIKSKKLYNSKGLAYIYSDFDYVNKVTTKKMNNNIPQIAHNKLRTGTLIKLINPKTKESIILKTVKKTDYPEFYKILITSPVADILNLKKNLPLIELLEVKKNKSFIAKKTKIFNEERKIYSNAPIEKVTINNISRNKSNSKIIKNDKIFIIIAEFYSENSALLLKKRITKELKNFDGKKLNIKTNKTNKTSLFAGPYNSINLMKNDYIQLKNFGFEELDISINE